MKRKLWLTALIPLLVISLVIAGAGCPTPKSGSGTTLDDIQDQVDAYMDDIQGTLDDMQEEIDDLRDDVDSIAAPNLSGYATDAELDSALDGFINNLTADQVTALKTKLGIPGTTPPTTSTGKVTVEITDGSNCDYYGTELRDIFSGDTPRFTIEAANDAGDIRYVYVSLILTMSSGTASARIDATLENLTHGISYTALVSPDKKSITFVPSSTNQRFRVRDGETEVASYRLSVKSYSDLLGTTTINTTWDGNLTYNASKNW